MKIQNYFDSNSYLNKVWPKEPRKFKGWEENKWLLSQYVSVARYIQGLNPKKWSNLDISTGPTLAPSLVFISFLDNLQLSDFGYTNRKLLQEIDISYWENYAWEVLLLEGQKPTIELVQERLSLLDSLRKKNPPLMVDIKKRPVLFIPNIDPTQYDLLSMHFVADSITSSKEEYLELISNVLNLLKRGDILVMSSLIESTEWDDGKNKFPSPNLKMNEITDLLIKKKLRVILENSLIPESPQGQNGGIGVTLSIKE